MYIEPRPGKQPIDYWLGRARATCRAVPVGSQDCRQEGLLLGAWAGRSAGNLWLWWGRNPFQISRCLWKHVLLCLSTSRTDHRLWLGGAGAQYRAFSKICVLLLENTICMISTLGWLLKFALWPGTWPIFINYLYVLVKVVYSSLVGYRGLYTSTLSSFLHFSNILNMSYSEIQLALSKFFFFPTKFFFSNSNSHSLIL